IDTISLHFFYMTQPPTHIYTLSLHDALPISTTPTSSTPSTTASATSSSTTTASFALDFDGARDLTLFKYGGARGRVLRRSRARRDRKSTRLNSSHVAISYAVFCLKKKTHTVT